MVILLLVALVVVVITNRPLVPTKRNVEEVMLFITTFALPPESSVSQIMVPVAEVAKALPPLQEVRGVPNTLEETFVMKMLVPVASVKVNLVRVELTDHIWVEDIPPTLN
jgi:hypothetical protein